MSLASTKLLIYMSMGQEVCDKFFAFNFGGNVELKLKIMCLISDFIFALCV